MIQTDDNGAFTMGDEIEIDIEEELSEQSINEIGNFNDMLAQDMENVEESEAKPKKTPKKSENNHQKIQKEVMIKPLDPDKPVNFLELTEEQQNLLKDLDSKIQRIDIDSLDSESQGIIKDIREKMVALDENTNTILNYFSKDISSKDRKLINRTTLMRRNLSELYGLLKHFESKDYAGETRRFEKSFKELVKNSKARVDNFENSLKSILSAKTESYHDILQAFIQKQGSFLDKFHNDEILKAEQYSQEIIQGIQTSQEKLKETTKNFEITTKKIKVFSALLIGTSIVFGMSFGIVSAMTYLKFYEYREIETKMESLAQRINGISVKKDEKNHLILSFPKTTTTLSADENKFHLTIKEENK